MLGALVAATVVTVLAAAGGVTVLGALVAATVVTVLTAAGGVVVALGDEAEDCVAPELLDAETTSMVFWMTTLLEALVIARLLAVLPETRPPVVLT